MSTKKGTKYAILVSVALIASLLTLAVMKSSDKFTEYNDLISLVPAVTIFIIGVIIIENRNKEDFKKNKLSSEQTEEENQETEDDSDCASCNQNQTINIYQQCGMSQKKEKETRKRKDDKHDEPHVLKPIIKVLPEPIRPSPTGHHMEPVRPPLPVPVRPSPTGHSVEPVRPLEPGIQVPSHKVVKKTDENHATEKEVNDWISKHGVVKSQKCKETIVKSTQPNHWHKTHFSSLQSLHPDSQKAVIKHLSDTLCCDEKHLNC